jgi:hypothetical protein
MGDEEFLLEHGYIGNEVDAGDPLYVDEAFEDALESFDDEESDSDHTSTHSPPPQIVLPRTFPNLVSGYPETPEFTNYAVDFTETLDYIFVSEPSAEEPYGFAPSRAAPVPTATFMEDFVAMPNEHMASDHVSLVCDLEWRCWSEVT